jgi:hypothetical protein
MFQAKGTTCTKAQNDWLIQNLGNCGLVKAANIGGARLLWVKARWGGYLGLHPKHQRKPTPCALKLLLVATRSMGICRGSVEAGSREARQVQAHMVGLSWMHPWQWAEGI